MSRRQQKLKVKNKLALQSVDLNNLSVATKQALTALEESRAQEVEAIIQAKLAKLLSHNKALRKLDTEAAQLMQIGRDNLLTLTAKQRKRLTITLPNERQTLIKDLRLKAAKLASSYLSFVHRKYIKEKKQILLQEAKAQQQQKSAPQIYVRKLFQNL